MDLFGNLLLGLQTAVTPASLLYCLLGTILGTLIGVLPGIGPTATIAMLLPITFALSPVTSLIMLSGIYYGAQYGGSTTAILINLPGEASSAVTAIDGYVMARQGRAGAALAIAAIGSFFAGCVGTLVIALFAQPMTSIALQFGPVEYFSLIVLGLILSVTLSHGSVVKAIAMAVLGLLFGVIGTDIYTSVPRFTFGFPELSDGVNIVAIAVGIFGVSEIIKNLETGVEREIGVQKVGSLMPTRADLVASMAPIGRGTLIGCLLGVLPGGGALLSSFASYSMERSLAKDPSRFGKGAIEGVAGPESANNAGAQTSFIPMLTLGIPSNPSMALMVGAMVIQGIQPGPNVMLDKPDLFWGLIVSMWIGNLMLVVLNLPLVGMWVKLLKVPYTILFPAIMLLSAIGVYSSNSNVFDVYAVAGFGLLSYVLIRLGCEPAPFLLGFILGPMLEEHLRRSMLLARGNPSIFIYHPISAVFIGLSVCALLAMTLPGVLRRREQLFVED